MTAKTVVQQPPPLPPNSTVSNASPSIPEHRAVHKIRLDALSHNYKQVESAANQQKCNVIVVVKADGYGHGALATAIHLADDVGADAFAVATLEEGIALRKAFQQNPPGNTTAILGGPRTSKPQPTIAPSKNSSSPTLRLSHEMARTFLLALL